MENASQALIIAGAILLAILIIAIGMYIYNSASATINDSLTNMSTQEIEAFNNQFESYKGKQTGSQISSLAGRLIANANTFADEPGKIPNVFCPQLKASTETATDIKAIHAMDGNQQNYINTLASIKNGVENKHAYIVEFKYHTSGVISQIDIKYNSDTDVEEILQAE